MLSRQKAIMIAKLPVLLVFLGCFLLAIVICTLPWEFNGHVISKIARFWRESTDDSEDDGYRWNTGCENSIYLSNAKYDCNGLLKGPTDWKGEDRIQENIARLIDQTYDVATNNDDVIIQSGGFPTMDKLIFINCGGTFPWSVEMFLETLPDTQRFIIYSFVADTSYEVFYRTIPNHSFVKAECSIENSLNNTKRRYFGLDITLDVTVQSMRLSDWIKANTQESDYVVLRIESEIEAEIIYDLVQTKAIAHIDKYYATLARNESLLDIGKIENFHRFGFWSFKEKMYSDVQVYNPIQIPLSGRKIYDCRSLNSADKFALLLMSKHYSINAEHVLKVLNKYSSQLDLPVTIFLPYSFFKFNTMATETIKSLRIGLYITNDVIPILGDSEFELNETTNMTMYFFDMFRVVVSAQKELTKHGKILEHVLMDDELDNVAIDAIQSQYNLNFIRRGRDISPLIGKVVSGEGLNIDDTGRTLGEYLMIDIDKEKAEYLAVYMIRRFRLQLVDLGQCGDEGDTGGL